MKSMGIPRFARVVFIFFVFFALINSFSHETIAKGKRAKAKAGKASSRSARNSRSRDRRGSRSASNRRRGGRREVARSRGRKMSKRELRAERQRQARDDAAYLAKLKRRGMSKRQIAAEMSRYRSGHRRALEEARRRAEAARLAAIARQRAIDEGMRNEVEADIAKDSTVGEDPEVRRAAVEALGHHAGTVVVMDPKTGRVYTVVNQDWGLRRGFKPCSTIKLVTGVAGISEKVIAPIETVSDGGRYKIDLTDALAYSNNTYFQHVAGEVGFDKMITYAKEMGLGEKTGINYVNEYSGRLPLFKSGFSLNRMGSHGDDFEVTAIQLATLVSAMSNGGKLLTPHLPQTVQENTTFKTEVRRKVSVESDTWKRMLPGMIGAVNYGSGRKAYRPEQTVAGKTGTCIGQDSSRAWVGLFTSYAPVVNPRLAVVVITRGTDAHNHVPAAIAGNIYRALSPRFGTQIDFQVAEGPDDAPNAPGKKAAALDEEAQETKAATEAEENADANAANATADPNAKENGNEKTAPKTTPATGADLKIKATTMPVESKPKAGAAANPSSKEVNDGRVRRTQPQPKP
ncbi:MAG TPA: penicillin-binding transpeptidase domain-containing protein [Pyrinomonadaceae bacterium]|nr:penicillin-binding transpeptidase domain-containing protein [Pyrinomonadaceae bacterium]